MKLINPSDLELDDAFTTRIAGRRWCKWLFHGTWIYAREDRILDWVPTTEGFAIVDRPPDLVGWQGHVERFTESAGDVLPWLEKCQWFDISYAPARGFHCMLTLNSDEATEADADASTFPKAAVIALLRAHGVEVEFTSPAT
jgi:hypothetical protein